MTSTPAPITETETLHTCTLTVSQPGARVCVWVLDAMCVQVCLGRVSQLHFSNFTYLREATSRGYKCLPPPQCPDKLPWLGHQAKTTVGASLRRVDKQTRQTNASMASSPTNGKRPIEPYELLVGLAREADVVAERAKKHARHNQEIACNLVQEAKTANALAREAEFNAVQIWDKAKKATPEGVDFEALKAQPPAKFDTPENTTKVLDIQEAEPGDDPEFDEAMMKAEQAAMEAAEAAEEEPEPPPEEATLNGFPIGESASNAELEQLLKSQHLKLTQGTYAVTGQVEQVIEPGLCGRKSDVYDSKEMLKACTPRFFFNAAHKQWRRLAPEGWSAEATQA